MKKSENSMGAMAVPPDGLQSLFKACANSVRLRIIYLLNRRTMNVSEMQSHLGIAQPTVSRHLHVLRDAGIIERHQEANKNYYSLNRHRFSSLHSFCKEILA